MWRFFWTVGISAAMMTALVGVMSAQGYSCSFAHVQAAIKSGHPSDFVTTTALCRQAFGHDCGGSVQVGGGSPTRDLHQAVALWSQRGRAMVTFLCN